MKKVLQFGKIKTGEKCIDRPGSYAIIEKDRKVLLVKITGWGKYFLPGGGIDDGENALIALHREVGEETGFLVKVLEKVGEANEYIFSPKLGGKINKISDFYRAEITGEDPSLKIELDHQVEWHFIEEAIEHLHLKSNKWAVEKALLNG